MCSSSSLTTPPSTPWKGWTHAWPSSTLPTSAPPCPAPSRSTRSAWPPMRADGTAARWSLSTRRLSSATSSTSTTAAITLFPSTTLGRFAQTSSLCLSRCKRNHFYIQYFESILSGDWVLPSQYLSQGRRKCISLRTGGADSTPDSAGQDDRYQRVRGAHDPPLPREQRTDHHGEQGAGGPQLCQLDWDHHCPAGPIWSGDQLDCFRCRKRSSFFLMKPTFQAISSLWAYCQILQARWIRSTTSQTKMKLSTTTSKTPWMSTSKASLEAPGRSNTCVHLCFPTLETSSSCECKRLFDWKLPETIQMNP